MFIFLCSSCRILLEVCLSLAILPFYLGNQIPNSLSLCWDKSFLKGMNHTQFMVFKSSHLAVWRACGLLPAYLILHNWACLTSFMLFWLSVNQLLLCCFNVSSFLYLFQRKEFFKKEQSSAWEAIVMKRFILKIFYFTAQSHEVSGWIGIWEKT